MWGGISTHGDLFLTVETAAFITSVEIFEVLVDIKNFHETNELLTKLQKHGFLKEEHYTWGTDEWNRPKRIRGKFTVLVKKEKQRSFKIMITQTENQTSSHISYTRLKKFF